MAPWELRLKRVQAMVDAMDLKAGDVITFTKSIQQRLGNSISRTYFMTIEEMNGVCAMGVNTRTGKPMKEWLDGVSGVRKVTA